MYTWTGPVAMSAPLKADLLHQTSWPIGRVFNKTPPDPVSSVTSPYGTLSASKMLRASVEQTVDPFGDTQILKTRIWVESEAWAGISDQIIDRPGWLTSEVITTLPTNIPTRLWDTKDVR